MQIKRNIILMYAIALLQGMVFYGPVATLYRQAAGVGIFEITLIESISLALCVALELPCGVLADRIGYKRMMLCCSGLYFLSKIVFWRASGFWMFLAERLMLSFVMAGLSGLDTSILYLSCGEKSAQKVFGIYNGLGTAGLLAAAGAYSLWIGDDYRLAGFLTVLGYGAALLLTFGLEDVKPASPHKTGRREFAAILRGTLGDRRLVALILGAALLRETNQTVTVFLNQLQYVKCGLGDRGIGLAYIAVTLAGLCAGLSSGVTKKLGERLSGGVMFALGCAACACLAYTRSAALSVGAIILLRLGASLFEPLQNSLQNRRVTVPDRATALSVNAVIMDAAAISTNLVFGAAAKENLSSAMLFGSAICLLGGAMFLYGIEKVGKENG